MGCGCGGKRERWIVTLPGRDGKPGMRITKSSESQAKAFADKHPGATYAKA